MIDRELLELAAKAAGFEESVIMCGIVVGPIWNPLTDDGDALRLAVKLDIDLMFKPRKHIPSTLANYGNREDHGDDQYAATRRAIVRAAAEIGKGMK
jgi:hypothetical protein